MKPTIKTTIFCSVIVTLAGCNQPPAPVVRPSSTTNNVAQPSGLDTVREELRRPFAEPDQLHFALEHLSDTGDKPVPLDAATVEFLKTKLLFNEADIREINRAEFSPIDAHVVYQGLFFSDAARTLEVAKATPAERAKAAMSWVNRHVRIEDRPGPPDPPALVSQRGTGTALERTYVFAAICQALDLESWLVGDAEAADNTSRLWGVGVVASDQVLLFDARLGISLPGNWSDLVKDGAPLKPLNDLGYDVTPERVKASKFYLSKTLTSLAPRMSKVDQVASAGSHFAVNAKNLVETSNKLPVAGWDAKARNTPVRTLAEFLPAELGGIDKPLPGQPPRMSLYMIGLLPWESFPRGLDQFPGALGQQLRASFVNVAGCDRQPGIAERVKRRKAIIEGMRNQVSQEKEGPGDPRLQNDIVQSLSRGMRATVGDDQGPTLRQLMLRGQYSETTEATDALSTTIRTIRNRDGNALGAYVDGWSKKVQTVYVEAQQARQRNDAQRLAAAEKMMLELQPGMAQAVSYVEWRGAAPALAKLASLTATVKHDQAVVNARNNKPDAWKTTIGLWESFGRNYPGTLESSHAQRMLADALAASGQKPAAGAAYKKAAELSKNSFEKLACNYLASIP